MGAFSLDANHIGWAPAQMPKIGLRSPRNRDIIKKQGIEMLSYAFNTNYMVLPPSQDIRRGQT